MEKKESVRFIKENDGSFGLKFNYNGEFIL